MWQSKAVPKYHQNGPQMSSGVIIPQFEAFIMLAGLHKVADFGIAADNMAIFLLLSANFGNFCLLCQLTRVIKRQKGRFIMMQGAILVDITQKLADKMPLRRKFSARLRKTCLKELKRAESVKGKGERARARGKGKKKRPCGLISSRSGSTPPAPSYGIVPPWRGYW